MKSFRDAVKREMEKEGWRVSVFGYCPERKVVQLHCKRGKKEVYVRATGNGHGHLYKWVIERLKAFKKLKKAPVFVAKVNGANEIIFIRLEKFLKPKKEETKAPELTLAQPRERGFIAYQNGEFKKGGKKW